MTLRVIYQKTIGEKSLDIATKLFLDKLYDALRTAGIQARQINVRSIGGSQYHIDSILENKGCGGVLIEEAKIVRNDYRFKDIEETQNRLGSNRC